MAEEFGISSGGQVLLLLVFTPLAGICVVAAPASGLLTLPPAALFAGVVGWAGLGGPAEPPPLVRWLLLGGAVATLLVLAVFTVILIAG